MNSTVYPLIKNAPLNINNDKIYFDKYTFISSLYQITISAQIDFGRSISQILGKNSPIPAIAMAWQSRAERVNDTIIHIHV